MPRLAALFRVDTRVGRVDTARSKEGLDSILDPRRVAYDRCVHFDQPFLLGRRACLGEHFAMLEGVVALAMIVDRHRLEPVDHDPIHTRPITTLRLARPLRMRVHARRSPASP